MVGFKADKFEADVCSMASQPEKQNLLINKWKKRKKDDRPAVP